MTTPPKCEDLYLKIAELERRESDLMEKIARAGRVSFSFFEERDALQQRLAVAEQRAGDAIELLEVWRTWLGFNRASCDDGGKRIWDRIDAVVALKPAEVITPEEDHWEK